MERSYRVIAGLIEPAAQGSVMIKIAITAEAFEAIARTLPLGSVAYENEVTERGERTVWLEEVWVDRLGAMRGPKESYSDVILRMAGRTSARDPLQAALRLHLSRRSAAPA